MLKRFSSWRQLYSATLTVSERANLIEVVRAAELAMLARLKELTISPEHHDERNEIRLALSDLLAVKTHKLGWPALIPTKSC
jgi:hypothetical protein